MLMQILRRFWWLILALIVLAGVGIWLIGWLMRPFIPGSIVRQSPFVLIYPHPSTAIIYQTSSFKYDANIKQFSFVVHYNNQDLVFSEQPAAPQFTDIKTYYSKFIGTLGGYASFNNTLGQVDLTRPSKPGLETAVMVTNGTLLFAKSQKDMSEDAWRQLFNNLVLVQGRG
jgi:hypothetical protein